ncbi:MAG: PepSY domain-containing protein [Pseudomonas sp.]|uniref:PepSY domain-containing protein n=1 Tax=Pseudomonas sp. TaxID=306 RepID=UPI0027361B8D|nr:PepSY domain-containing protein [Pseudomonas sp.]MDP3847434.1 PepSY domain-containing protein [Pseudomonas sp.]
MNAFSKLFTVAALSAVAALAQARDLGADETQKLIAAGTIQSVEKLNAAAIFKHPGATIEETDLEQENGQYIYEVDLHDAQGLQWDLELDATNGKVLKDHQDT